MLRKFYRKPALSRAKMEQILSKARWKSDWNKEKILTEWCIYVEMESPLNARETGVLKWLLAETFEPDSFSEETFLSEFPAVLEAGPRLNFETAWSSTAVAICRACGLDKVKRIERSLRVGLPDELSREQQADFLAMFYDRMTQMPYPEPLENFESGAIPEAVRIIPVIEKGREALRAINKELGFSWDDQDIEMVHRLFTGDLKRNPTDVEIGQIGQANSEHSRHPFFRGRLVIDGQPIESSLMDIIKSAWRKASGNAVVAFNGAVVNGARINTLLPAKPGRACAFQLERLVYHLTLTAETHNYPSGVSPYHGAATGSGGRARDNRINELLGVSGAAYCTGNLHIPGYDLPWEDDGWTHPDILASPLDIMIEASNGASDYQNCLGEPLIYGFVRTFGAEAGGEYRAWFKPVMYTVGAGQKDSRHVVKGKLEKGMLVLQIGGPAYRIGLGGAAASSRIQEKSNAVLDFNAVQRGDPEMEQKTFRLIQACVEMGQENPIVAIQDLGAGGDCNALPELVYPAGARIELRKIPLGDKTLSVFEYWCNESQERMVFAIRAKHLGLIEDICRREKIPCAVVGEITGDGKIVVYDDGDGTTPVDLPLEKILGDIPPKTFQLERIRRNLKPLRFPEDMTFLGALNRVLRLPSVCSKRYLTTKADRSVTGLVAQQQCVGPNQITLSDYAVMAQSHFGLTGVALSLGEQPIKGLISPRAMARLAAAEMLLNMAGARITKSKDIKCLANWMVAAKLPGEGAWLYDAASALEDIVVAIGGKDSLSMAVEVLGPDGAKHIVKAPGQLVIAGYAPMRNVTRKVTPDLKKSGNTLIYINLSPGKNRLGGSALAQAYKQVGNDCPDVEDVESLKRTFRAVQKLVKDGLALSVHDRSDGGLITTLLEMAFAGNLGFDISLSGAATAAETFFSEEPGLVVECDSPRETMEYLARKKIPAREIGKVGSALVRVEYNGEEILLEPMIDLRKIWEETSTALDALQANPECVREEALVNYKLVSPPPYRLAYKPCCTPKKILESRNKPKVAIVREEGTNGDREMISAFWLAGFEPWDVTMDDLISERVNLDDFRGLVFPGGFTFGDVFDAAKGWAGVIRFNERLAKQLKRFYERPDTFTLGVCNGCQLMALLGWVPIPGLPDEERPRFIRNESGRFESRFSMVRIKESPAIMLEGMAGSTLGVWVAHGEGRLHLPNPKTLGFIVKNNLAPICFVDNDGYAGSYPSNPNGSVGGITALCSPDGRHLAMMPHPERTVLAWQWPWLPPEWKDLKASPWLRMFQNAYAWCVKNDGKKRIRKENA